MKIVYNSKSGILQKGKTYIIDDKQVNNVRFYEIGGYYFDKSKFKDIKQVRAEKIKQLLL